MNCVLFRKMTVDLARGRVLEANMRQDGLAHAEACRACALLLAEQQILSINLRAYREDSVQQAIVPARLEADLRAAFRAHHRAALVTVPQWSRERAWVRRRAIAAIAATAAAAAAVVLAVMAPHVNQPPPAPVSAAQLLPGASSPAVIDDQQTSAGAVPDNDQDLRQTLARDVAMPRKTKRAAVSRRDIVPIAASRPATSGTEEIATDFFALGESARQSPLDGGQIVRVAVPRSTLVSFGLPVNMDRESETIQAEILLGHDGVARAIRFVKKPVLSAED